ncbi:Predicted DNA-binding protein, MmcQ/YjbR family [Zhouia amylolytica]|uniref:MmcQ-like protein n=2 Tax=Zhouia amylolytica TaxID=376730 RepID=W2UKG8_9FLAO|nr:MmcQ/YjbR family DNA-binding protein [Zhouia amylolytica]ETN94498.1 hypothetical protein P278_24410 [Zhouia amylolytica AD3]MCQ0110274.1 MmcQ/YjbR family DNA-binding protein [Zhouia amylolytica]SFT12957.1 Predicted DNA-binding protein, MmcQ/YjbR family [Zhouia amylolytica]
MHIEAYRAYCISKKGVTEAFPFNEDVLVFKVMGKMFALSSLMKWEEGTPEINLKCDPDWARELREEYEGIQGGYHMSKKHWNTISLSDTHISDVFLQELIDHSYDLIVASLPKKDQKALRSM